MPRITAMEADIVAPSPEGVVVERLHFDWGDTSRIPHVERRRILNSRMQGCWYVNPQYEVHSVILTPDFFFKARKCQGAWFRTLERHFPGGGWRNMMALAQTELERDAAFNGILIIDGHECVSSNWNAVEQLLGLRPRVRYHPPAFRMAAQQDWNGLTDRTRSELQREMAANPEMALFITPGVTVVGIPLHSFYREARKRRAEWHSYLTRTWGEHNVATFARNVNLITRMLAINGTLVIDGNIYVPGLWPGRPLTKKSLAKSPFGSPFVPPKYLGLEGVALSED